MAKITLKLPIAGPFDPARFFNSLETTSFGMPFTRVGSDTAARTLQTGVEAVLVTAKFQPNGGSYHLIVELSAEQTLLAQTDWRDRVTHVFGCEDALEECYALLGRDPVFEPLIKRHFGYRMVRAPDLFETLFTVILGQQISVTAANAQRRRLLDFFADSIKYRGQAIMIMVDAVRIAETPVDTFKNLGISRQKIRYLREAARWAAEGRLERSLLEKLSRDDAIDYLRAIPGVGQWTAEIVLMRGVGDMDIFPADDIGLQKIVQQLYRLDQRPSATQLADFALRWQGWRSYAALYLWMDSMG